MTSKSFLTAAAIVAFAIIAIYMICTRIDCTDRAHLRKEPNYNKQMQDYAAKAGPDVTPKEQETEEDFRGFGDEAKSPFEHPEGDKQ